MNPSILRPRVFAAALACSIAALITHSADAQTTATTDPVGFITLNIAGNGGASASALSFSGLGLTRPVEYQGNAEGFAANSLTDNDAAWTDNQFNGAAGAYFVELTSGTAAGTTYDISATTASTKTITLAQSLAAGVANGVTFKIRKHWTLASIFGAANESGLGSGNSSSADQILRWNGTGYDIYYYQTSGIGGIGWRKAGFPSTDASASVIYPEDGVIVQRSQSAAVPVVLMGAVKTGQTSAPVQNGINFVGNIYAAAMTLASSGIYTGNNTTGLAGGNSSGADQLLIWNGTGYDIYYYQTSGIGGIGWRKAGFPSTDASATSIPVGISIIIQRSAPGGFNWVMPQHPTTL